MSQLEEFYNVVSYPAFAYANTHPSRLATMAMLHGLQPAAIENCRVLEIGCNAGGNLVPMAYALPHSQFVGFDLAGDPIARGAQSIRDLGLDNIQLFQADIMDAEGLPELAGKFDYIIVHGLYAWIPEPVRDRLLGLCRSLLAKNGVAFISYNALPGGHLRSIARDILLCPRMHAEDTGMLAGTNESIEFLRFIASCRPEGDAFRVLLEIELQGMERRGASVVIHDEMTPAFRPVSITEFVQHASQHQLQYLAEASFYRAVDPVFKAEIALRVAAFAGGDPIAQEQIFDLIRMRMYRETLLCHADATVTYDPQLDGLRQLEFQTTASSTAGTTGNSRVYTSTDGLCIESQHPGTIAVLEHLVAISPESATFAAITAVLHAQGIDADQSLMVMLMKLVVSRMVHLHAWHPPVSRTVAAKPVASKICRDAAVSGAQAATLFHTIVDLSDPVVRQLVPLLDGSRDRDQLLRDLALQLPDTPPQQLHDGLGAALQFLAQTGTLEIRQT